MFWRYLITGVLIIHGLGHIGGPWFLDRCWLLPSLGEGAVRWLFILLWMVAMLGFVGAGLGILGILVPPGWWRPLAITAAVIFLPVTLLFLGAVATGNKFACIAVGVVILVALLWARWPTADIIGS